MNLQKLSDNELLAQTKSAAFAERDATLFVLEHLREVERRMLYAREYPSLFEYCVHELGYDGGSAQHRIAAMRLLRDLPELAGQVEAGALTLTVMSQAQSFFRKEKIKSLEQKREVMMTLKGLSTRDAQCELMSRAEVPEIHRPERVRFISSSHVEIRFLADEGLMDDIEALKAMLGEGSIQEILRVAVRECLQKRRPKRSLVLHAREVGSQAEIKRRVFERDEDQCTYVSPTGNRCRVKARLELDHIVPKAKGGVFSVDNLRLRCRTHNQLAAVEAFGPAKMEEYIPKLRH